MSDTLFGSDNSAGRRRAMLRTAMGPTIAAALADPVVIEIMVNPDGVLRLDRLGEGRIEDLDEVGGAHDKNKFIAVKPIHFREQLIYHGVFHSTSGIRSSSRSE